MGLVYVLLPAYNEERDICSLLTRICSAARSLDIHDYKVLVVNDGSTDQTVSVVMNCQQEMPIELIDHGINKGLGQAMLTGLNRASQLVQDDDVLVAMDADNTHDPGLIGPMLVKIQEGADVVIASRYEKGGKEVGLSEMRRFLSQGASSLLRIFFPIRGVKDFTCGFRAYRGSVLKRAFQTYGDHLVEERGFTCMAEILIKLSSVGANVVEVPLVLRYDLKSGSSKMKVIRTILRYFVLIAHNITRRPVNALQVVKGAGR